MRSEIVTVTALLFALGSAVQGQVPAQLERTLVLTLGGASAGSETYQVERTAAGYRLSGDVDLSAMAFHVVQQVWIEADSGLAFSTAHVEATVNGEPLTVEVGRQGGTASQETTRGDSTSSQDVETPPGSLFMAGNVIHHIFQFAWLHSGAVGVSREFVVYPRVPVTVTLEEAGTVSSGGATLAVRRYYLNLANRLGAYVWLAENGTPLKLLVPLQSFTALDKEYQSWDEQLTLGTTPAAGAVEDYEAEEVTFRSDTILLAGTLTLPRGDERWPAVVLISGSGAQDRDENTPGPGGLKLGIFRSIADALTRRGIAVLRYDDRGVGGSGGDLSAAGLSDLVSDVGSAVAYLRGRREIAADRIGLVGHSEGAIIAPMVAAEDTQLAAVALMAGTATPLDSVIMEQIVGAALAAGGDSTELAESRKSIQKLVKAIRAGEGLEDADLPIGLKMLGSNEKWLREHIEHDPLATIQRVRAPVLIVNGGQDVQVSPEHARRLGSALAMVEHPDYEVKIFPELNHLFAASRGEGTAEYADPKATVDGGFLSYLADWLVERLNRR
ncbi:MAG: alpha/beta fold hydrolase [Gemmatimonadota bacterium]|nr:MAG: alpha/beta fold hydrolase [Gemmatimonadota bacterium]